MPKLTPTRRELLQTVEELQTRLQDAEATWRAIRLGEVDALVISGPDGDKIFTREGAERPYRMFVESMNEGTVTLLPDATVAYCNRRFADLVRTPLETIIGSPFHRFIAPHQAPLFRALLEQAGSEGGKGEFSLLGAGGSLLPAQLSVRLLDLTQPRGFCLVVTDLTEHKAAERAYSFLAAIVESADVSIVGTNLEGTVIAWNRGAERLYGYSAEEMVGRSISVVLPPEADELGQILERLRQGQPSEAYDTSGVRKDGRAIDVALSFSPIRDAAGKLTGISAIARDISQRRRAEAARQAAEANFSAVVESTSDLIWAVDLDYRLRTFNRALAEAVRQALGFRPTVGMRPEDLLPPKRAAALFSMYQRALSEGPIRTEYSLLGATLELAVSPIVQDGRQTGVSVIGKDITERKRAEEKIKELNASLEQRVAELSAANKELETFSYSVSHDLRAPLREMDGFSLALIEDYADVLEPEARRYLDHVRDASRRMDYLVNGILDLSRASRSELQCTKVDMSALAQAIGRQLKRENPERCVELEVASGLVLSADSNLLRRVLENLLGNAWKFTSKHLQARIEVGSLQQDGDTVYFVRDDGAGFDQTYAGQLFGPFQRLHSLAEFPGSGIGLAIVQRIIHRHGGRVWAEAEVEKGATFYFTLP